MGRMTTGHRPGGSRFPAHAHLADAGLPYSGLDRIIDTVRQPLIVLDEKLHIIFVNRAFYRAFAVTPEETIGQHLAAAGGHRLLPALHGFLDLIQVEGHAIEITRSKSSCRRSAGECCCSMLSGSAGNLWGRERSW